ncbi:unnamed protein product [Pieris macdunnoughi]|uniref:Uncharacterized protein n=1 Tax=Pieris macdunnoughi TaxID=345717 RepID=A0A821XMJ9_9NEOP|nr:unnamed protein product [Pieris macdunnoughi]
MYTHFFATSLSHQAGLHRSTTVVHASPRVLVLKATSTSSFSTPSCPQSFGCALKTCAVQTPRLALVAPTLPACAPLTPLWRTDPARLCTPKSLLVQKTFPQTGRCNQAPPAWKRLRPIDHPAPRSVPRMLEPLAMTLLASLSPFFFASPRGETETGVRSWQTRRRFTSSSSSGDVTLRFRAPSFRGRAVGSASKICAVLTPPLALAAIDLPTRVPLPPLWRHASK